VLANHLRTKCVHNVAPCDGPLSQLPDTLHFRSGSLSLAAKAVLPWPQARPDHQVNARWRKTPVALRVPRLPLPTSKRHRSLQLLCCPRRQQVQQRV
jgi:hypothetical protein